MSMIQVSHLTFHYEDGSENIFEDVSFEVGYELEIRFDRTQRERQDNAL